MVRVPTSLALAGLMALSLAACGSPETAPAAEQAPAATSAAEQTPVMPDDAPPQEEAVAPEDTTSADADAGSCTAAVGSAAAIRLAERCTMVSPASHPPCNPANPCALIQGEIDRACGQYGPGETRPAECSA